jgi:hypothetical protein
MNDRLRWVELCRLARRPLSGALPKVFIVYAYANVGKEQVDAPLAQLDRALGYELLWCVRLSPRLFSIISRLGPPSSGQKVTD